MKLIELHILQSFPVTCLNRDDVGSPKTANFGGTQRARVSSQSLKRAARLDFNDAHHGNPFHTERTKLAHEGLIRSLASRGLPEESAQPIALEVLSSLVDKGGASKAKVDKSGRMNMPALIWLSPAQIQAAATAIIKDRELIENAFGALQDATEKKAKDKAQKACKNTLKPVIEALQKEGISDAPDIALFGRMVANSPTLNIEGAAMFSHALSTHSSTNEVDFYSAVDDVKYQRGEDGAESSEDTGAGMIGTLEFNSATYYRYVAINLDLLFDTKHLEPIEQEARKEMLGAFISAVLTSVPGARKNSMNGATLPIEVLGIRKDKGQPLQLINAFEAPIKARGKGYAATSTEEMLKHHDDLKRLWNIEEKCESLLTKDGLATFLKKLLSDDV